MASVIYSPMVSVKILSSKRNEIIDVSEDVIRGSTELVLGPGISVLDLTLLNAGRKYDTLFSPMDRFVVRMRRLRTMLVMSGYLDTVPLFSATPGSVRLRGSSTLKLLKNFYWDPSSPKSIDLIRSTTPEDGVELNDGGLASRSIDLLSQVGGWDKGRIHIAGIPDDWFDKLAPLADKMQSDADVASLALEIGGDSYLNGESPSVNRFSQIPGIGPGTGRLPATRGRISHFGGPGGGAYGNMALTGESGVNPRDPWYVAMRWPYTEAGGTRAKAWWANRRVIVSHPKTGKAVVLRAADWGPHASTGRVVDVSPHAMKVLGASTDDIVHISFAEKSGKSAPLGKINMSKARETVTDGNGVPLTANRGWGSPGQSVNMRKVTVRGVTFSVHKNAVDNFVGFVKELQDRLGYKPKSIGGYAYRKIAGSSTWSNHAYGAAIDIDPSRNPYYSSASGGRYALPGPDKIVPLARKWGLGWGGEWRNSKDYMHFEVIGAPSSASYKNVKPASGATTRWVTPVKKPYTVTARFGDQGKSWANGHSGTDFAVGAGRPIRPVGPGIVKDTGFDSLYGNYVSVEHFNANGRGGVFTFYAHMQAGAMVNPGAKVDTKSTLGLVGSTGNSSGSHLHLELRIGEDTYAAALRSGGIERYVLGNAPPPRGVTGTLVDGVAGSGAGELDPNNMGGGLLNAMLWYQNVLPTEAGWALTGYRALMNDVPLLDSVSEYMTAGFRDFTAAPNGDFIAWFPDYFGWYGTAGKMVVSPLEIDGVGNPPSIEWSDDNLKTHQFAVGSKNGSLGNAGDLPSMLTTAGIASIEQPDLVKALLNVNDEEAEAISSTMARRFGARPSTKTLRQISGPRQEFYFACMEFMKNWSAQFRTSIGVSFMPEMYPGMLACFPYYGMQGYVWRVRHDFDLTGGGFSTEISCAPWSSIGKKGPGALPKGAPL